MQTSSAGRAMRALQPKRVAVAGVALIGGLAAPLVLAPSAGAATITVTSTADDGSAGTLRDAFAQANANPGPNTIVLATGATYQLTDCVQASLLSTSGPLEILGNGSTIRQTCLIDGVNPDPGVISQLDTNLLTITDTTLTGGNLSAGGGGGVFSLGPITLVNSTVTGNSAPAGGGVASFGGTITLTNSHVDTNNGLIFGGIFASGPVVLTDSTVNANTGGLGTGGINAAGDITLTNSHVDDNGGQGLAASGTATITDSTVSRNAKGGASGNTAITVTNSVIAGNTGATLAGGIETTGNAVVTGSTIADNVSTGFAGGIAAGDLDLSFSSVTGNQTTSGGGGATIETGMTAVNSTITSNVSADVGGISAGGTVNLRYVTLAANGGAGASQLGASALDSAATVFGVGSGGPTCVLANPTTSNGYNYEQTSNTCGLTGTGDVASGADPQLLALASNGGPTMTHLFATGSGLHDAVPAAIGLCTGTAKDQRGYTRPQGVGCDIGAVEMRLPTASNGSATTTVGVPVNTDLHPLVADPDGWLAGATYSVNPPPANGTTQTTGNGQVLYTPGGGFAGSDAYGYVVTDSRNVSSVSATINVTVTGTPPAPANPANPISATPAFTG